MTNSSGSGRAWLKAFWNWLTTPPDESCSFLRVIWWWELRRIPYNVIVGMVGIVSLLIFFGAICCSGMLNPGEDAVEPMALFLAPVMANFFYTAGWVVELALRMVRVRSPRIGPDLWLAGTSLSLMFVWAPSALWLFLLPLTISKR